MDDVSSSCCSHDDQELHCRRAVCTTASLWASQCTWTAGLPGGVKPTEQQSAGRRCKNQSFLWWKERQTAWLQKAYTWYLKIECRPSDCAWSYYPGQKKKYYSWGIHGAQVHCLIMYNHVISCWITSEISALKVVFTSLIALVIEHDIHTIINKGLDRDSTWSRIHQARGPNLKARTTETKSDPYEHMISHNRTVYL